jgi:hypothetical protein
MKGVKPRELTEDESFESYEKWQSLLTYCLNREADWQRFLKSGSIESKWKKLTSTSTDRGFADDHNGKTKTEKATYLKAMLEYIAQFCPHFLHHEIVEDSVGINSVWTIIRQYYNLQPSEAHFLNISQIKWAGSDKERPERLYRRIVSHVKDNLLKKDSPLKHNKETPEADEFISPTTERLLVIRWLEAIDQRLPSLVKRVFATELLSNTLKDIQPQIANAMDSLLEQLAAEDTQVSRLQSLHLDDIQASHVSARGRSHVDDIQASHVSARGRSFTRGRFAMKRSSGRFRGQASCPPNQSGQRLCCNFCQGWNRPSWGHTMASCKFISDADKKGIARGLNVSFMMTEDTDEIEPEEGIDEYEDEE